jgi:hypothetical protein
VRRVGRTALTGLENGRKKPAAAAARRNPVAPRRVGETGSGHNESLSHFGGSATSLFLIFRHSSSKLAAQEDRVRVRQVASSGLAPSGGRREFG